MWRAASSPPTGGWRSRRWTKSLSGSTEPSQREPAFGRCRTAEEPLLPPAETAGRSGILPPEFNRQVVEHYCAHEWAVHLDDLMVRRTSWQHYCPDAGQRAERVADWMGEWFRWSAATREAEIERYRAAVDWPLARSVAAPAGRVTVDG